MENRRRPAAFLAAMVLAGGIVQASAVFAAGKPILGDMKVDNDAAVQVVRDDLVRFQRTTGHWPASLAALGAAFAGSGQPVNLAAFATTKYSVRAQGMSSVALFEFTMAGSGAKGAFAVSYISTR